MVFSSVPIYLDPPNWNQEVSSQQEAAGEAAAAAAAAAHQVVVQQPHHEGNSVGVGGSSSSSRAGASMAERARLAKVAQPEAGLKCPRCDSTNTKFCYFNNYSLSQPRHFCKTCRRYWTRGGALRSVPVGGGCRRNKRSKGGNAATKSSSSSSCSDVRHQPAPAATSTSSHHHLPLPPQLPFMASLHPLNLGAAIQTLDAVDFQVGTSCSGAGLEQWRVQQFPFLAGLMEPASVGMFPFEGEGVEGVVGGGAFAGQVHGRASASGLITHLASVKMEESPQEQQLILPKQYLGIPGTGTTTTNTTTDHYWGGVGGGGSSSGGWVDLSGFNTSSTGNIL